MVPQMPAGKRIAGFGKYIIATIAVALATAVHWYLFTSRSTDTPLILYLLVISLVSLSWGFKVGIFTVILSAFAGDFVLFDPGWSLVLTYPADGARVIIFIIEGLVISYASGAMLSARNAAADARNQLERAQQSAKFASWNFDLRTQELTWSGAFEEVYPGEEVFDARTWSSRLVPEDLDHLSRTYGEAISVRGNFDTMFRFKSRDGGIRWIITRGSVICDDHGDPVSLSGINSDVTHRKEGEEELRQAKEAAESANRAKTAFLANVSHEIRTPLGAVVGFSELLTSYPADPEERQHYVKAIRRNGKLLTAIINDILDLSKVEVGKLEVECQQITLDEVLTDLSSVLRLQAEEKGLRLTVVTGIGVPAVIETDPLRLRQILFNVVGNAIKFTEHGSVDVHVTYADQKLIFDVRDTGPGISLMNSTRLFEPFSQVDSTAKRRFGGTGLGLVLSKRLAKLLDGDVVLTESEVGVGSHFTISVGTGNPAVINPDDVDRAASPGREVVKDHLRLDGVNVLLVDDAPDNQLLVSRLLKIAGANVDTAGNGREALEKAQRHDYDVLLMDLQMPIMDGYEATARLREDGFGAPIIALTAHAMKEERQRSLRSGFDDHINKPVDRRILLESIARHSGRPSYLN